MKDLLHFIPLNWEKLPESSIQKFRQLLYWPCIMIAEYLLQPYQCYQMIFLSREGRDHMTQDKKQCRVQSNKHVLYVKVP